MNSRHLEVEHLGNSSSGEQDATLSVDMCCNNESFAERNLGSAYRADQFMNPGPAPRPPTDRPRLNAFPSTQNVPGNFSQLSLSSASMRSNTTLANGYEPSTPGLSRTTTLSDGYGSGGISVLREGPAKVKDGMLWKQRYLVLRAYQLDFLKSQDGKVDRAVQLKDITSVARSESVPLSFELSRVANPTPTTGTAGGIPARDLPQKTIVCQFRTDDEIYEWIDAIYSRCPGMGGVSNPTNFSHRVHVGFDPVNGSFIGLPPEWERLLTSSAITKEDYKKHPQAVIEVLEFYSDIHKPPEQGEDFSSQTSSPMVNQKSITQYGQGGGGASIAPPRPQPPNGYHQRPSFDNPPRSQTGTPASGQRNISGGGPLDQNQKKMNMDLDMRRAMEEEARKIKAVKEQRERDRAREEEQTKRKEDEAYNASIPKTRTPMAKQEISGYGGGSDSGSSSARYNPTRTAPPAPTTDRSRPQQPGSLRTQPAQRQAPQAPSSINGHTEQQPPPRPPYTQRSPSSRDQSPTQASLRTPQREQQRQPSPSSRLPVNGNDRNQSPQTARAQGLSTNGQAQAPARAPGPSQHVPPLNVGTKQPTGAPATNGAQLDPVKQAEMALTAKPSGGRQKEVRMSSMTESQVMEKLKQVVSKDNPEQSYQKQKKIGQGASGSVYVARIIENAASPIARRLYKTYGAKANVAIKQMDLRNQPRKELIVNEIIVMKESSHPNIVNFLDSFLQQENNELWVIMEFMEGGALTDVIDNNATITEAQISTICNEVSQAFDEM